MAATGSRSSCRPGASASSSPPSCPVCPTRRPASPTRSATHRRPAAARAAWRPTSGWPSSSPTSPGRCPATACSPGSSPSWPTCRPENITILNGTGSHRINTPAELSAMVGPEVLARYRVVNHDSQAPEALALAGHTRDGRPVHLARDYVQADRRIVLGFIEPHFMAGFSGGYKGVFPAIADIDAIMHYHRAEAIGHPSSTWGVLEGNPTQEQIRWAGSLLPVDFLVNVTLNRKRQITRFFCGEVLAAHAAGCAFARQTAMAACERRYPIVVTTNAGYPARPEPLPGGQGHARRLPGGRAGRAHRGRLPLQRRVSRRTATSSGCCSSTAARARCWTPSWRPASRSTTSGRRSCWPSSPCGRGWPSRASSIPGRSAGPTSSRSRTSARASRAELERRGDVPIAVLPEGPMTIPYIASPAGAAEYSRPPRGARPGASAIDRMSGYVPGEQPAAGREGHQAQHQREPLPAQPAGDGGHPQPSTPEWLRRYPNPTADAFREAAARVHGVTPDMIIAGNGSDEILAIVVRTFVAPGEVIAWPDPTYSLYPVLAEIGEARAVPVPWEDGWRPAHRGAAGHRRPGPSSSPTPTPPRAPWCRPRPCASWPAAARGVVLVDEAYVDFADGDCLPLLADCPNLIVSRTLSKGYALAGLRFGYALAAAPAGGADDEGQGQLQLRRPRHRRRPGRPARPGRTPGRAGSKVRAERTRLADELERWAGRSSPARPTSCWRRCPAATAARSTGGSRTEGILVRYFDKPGLAAHGAHHHRPARRERRSAERVAGLMTATGQAAGPRLDRPRDRLLGAMLSVAEKRGISAMPTALPDLPWITLVALPEQAAGVALLDRGDVGPEELRARLDRLLAAHAQGVHVPGAGGRNRQRPGHPAGRRPGRARSQPPGRLPPRRRRASSSGWRAAAPGCWPRPGRAPARPTRVGPEDDAGGRRTRARASSRRRPPSPAALEKRPQHATRLLGAACIVYLRPVAGLGRPAASARRWLRMGGQQRARWSRRASCGGCSPTPSCTGASFTWRSTWSPSSASAASSKGLLGWRRYLLLYGLSALAGGIASALLGGDRPVGRRLGRDLGADGGGRGAGVGLRPDAPAPGRRGAAAPAAAGRAGPEHGLLAAARCSCRARRRSTCSPTAAAG